MLIKIPHVLVVPYPSQGHINPLLQFAKCLASKGVKATIAATHYTAGSILAASVAVEAISDGFDRGGFCQAQNVDNYLKSFQENGTKSLSRLINKYQNSDSPISCIIYDSFFPWALDVAKQNGLFGASFFTNSATVCSIFCYIHSGKMALPVDVRDGTLNLPGLPPLNSCDVPGFITAPESYPAYLAMKLSQFSNLENADFVFCNSFQGLEVPARSLSKSWPAKLIGPMVPSLYLDKRIKGDKGYGASLWKPLSDECLNWLETKPRESVVYVSFGSMVSLTSGQMEEIACALTCGDLNFLWVVRETEMNKVPAEFIVSNEGKGLVVPWCNQLEMLENRAIGCFVTHCGWNSTLEGLVLGVPMVAMPQWADQMTDAKFIEEIWGVGVRCKEDGFGVVRREEILFGIKEVMEGERSDVIRRNAKKWRDLAKEAISEGGTSDNCVDEFVTRLKIKKSSQLDS